MAVDFIGFHQEYIREMREKIQDLTDHIVHGNATDWASYQFVVGKLHAYRTCLERYEELLTNMENANDR